jgi:NADP-dependent 3-hydroxy acid dehydrogenase YdfG
MIEIVMHILHHYNHEPALSTRIEKTYLGNVDNEEQKQSRKHMSNIHGQKLAGKIAVITGGNSGIGLATAKRFVEEGAYVVITGRREKELKEAAALIGRNVTTVVGDVTRLEDLDRLFAVV